MHFVAVHLTDASQAFYDKHKLLASMTLSLSALIGLEMPMINLITKMDLIKQLGRPEMNLAYY